MGPHPPLSLLWCLAACTTLGGDDGTPALPVVFSAPLGLDAALCVGPSTLAARAVVEGTPAGLLGLVDAGGVSDDELMGEADSFRTRFPASLLLVLNPSPTTLERTSRFGSSVLLVPPPLSNARTPAHVKFLLGGWLLRCATGGEEPNVQGGGGDPDADAAEDGVEVAPPAPPLHPEWEGWLQVGVEERRGLGRLGRAAKQRGLRSKCRRLASDCAAALSRGGSVWCGAALDAGIALGKDGLDDIGMGVLDALKARWLRDTPAANAEVAPEPATIAATVGVLLSHVPPPVASVMVMLVPAHIMSGCPEIATGEVLTVSTAVVEQPVVNV